MLKTDNEYVVVWTIIRFVIWKKVENWYFQSEYRLIVSVCDRILQVCFGFVEKYKYQYIFLLCLLHLSFSIYLQFWVRLVREFFYQLFLSSEIWHGLFLYHLSYLSQ